MMAASPRCAEQKRQVQVMGTFYGTPQPHDPPQPHVPQPLRATSSCLLEAKGLTGSPAGRTLGLTALPDLPQPGDAQITGEDGGGTQPAPPWGGILGALLGEDSGGGGPGSPTAHRHV